MSARIACFLLIFALALLAAPQLPAQQMPANNAPAVSGPKAPAAPPADPYNDAIAKSIVRMNNNDPDGAAAFLTQAIAINPRAPSAFILRASIYCQKKQWPAAEADFAAAEKAAPNNVVIKFNQAEVKFMQKLYDAARPGFVALTKDKDMGDFASFKVFLCDLLGGHADAAAKEYQVFNDAGGNPSYYFGNAAWFLVHKQPEQARGWLVSAATIYQPKKIALYSQSLRDLGYLPLPPPPQ